MATLRRLRQWLRRRRQRKSIMRGLDKVMSWLQTGRPKVDELVVEMRMDLTESVSGKRSARIRLRFPTEPVASDG